MGAFLNHWCATYDEARALRESQGGYLLPFKDQFFVTGAEGIEELGLDPQDPDWERIGFDWVRPLDLEAGARLQDKRQRALATPRVHS
jgi:hypothetical protein